MRSAATQYIAGNLTLAHLSRNRLSACLAAPPPAPQNSPMPDLSAINGPRPPTNPATLGDVLYAQAKGALPEQVWLGLVEAVAVGDQAALHALYEMTHRLIFTLILRLTANRDIAEELTLDVFQDVWRRAARFDRSCGSVLAWIMNLARAHAVGRLRAEAKKRGPSADAVPAPDTRDVVELRQQEDSMRGALAALTPDERRAIERTFFAGQTHVQASARLDQPPGIIKMQIGSGLEKLRDSLLPHARPGPR